MSRKRALISDTFRVTKKRLHDSAFGGCGEADQNGPLDVKSSLEYLMTLFPRKVFNDALPRIVLKHQLYSLHSAKTQVDRQVNVLREQGEIVMIQFGFDADAFGLVFTDDYKEKTLAGIAGSENQETVEKFLNKVLSGCTDLSFNKDKMLKEFLFTDPEITQLVKCGLLTVKDAGTWWLSIPNSGKFTKFLIQGRKAVLNMVKKAKYGEVLKNELETRRTTSQVKFPIKYHIYDLMGAELVESIPTTSGMLLRYADS